jgi:hypothetical protein
MIKIFVLLIIINFITSQYTNCLLAYSSKGVNRVEWYILEDVLHISARFPTGGLFFLFNS